MKILQELIDSTAIQIKQIKAYFKRSMVDKSISLDERWSFFIKSPAWLKDTSGFIEHFDCFKVYEDKHQRNFVEDDLYENINRGSDISTDEIEEHLNDLIEIHDDVTEETLTAFKEEVLSKNLGYVCFDW